jgi:hypothetical protein
LFQGLLNRGHPGLPLLKRSISSQTSKSGCSRKRRAKSLAALTSVPEWMMKISEQSA